MYAAPQNWSEGRPVPRTLRFHRQSTRGGSVPGSASAADRSLEFNATDRESLSSGPRNTPLSRAVPQSARETYARA